MNNANSSVLWSAYGDYNYAFFPMTWSMTCKEFLHKNTQDHTSLISESIIGVEDFTVLFYDFKLMIV